MYFVFESARPSDKPKTIAKKKRPEIIRTVYLLIFCIYIEYNL